MVDETSAGVVIFRRDGTRVLFLLLRYPAGHWDFVKGKIEDGESMQQTAIREAGEETGISDIEFVENFKEKIRYDFQHNGRLISKKVVFFLGETVTSDVLISHEHRDYVWMDYKAAMKRVTFNNARRVLLRSNARIAKTLEM